MRNLISLFTAIRVGSFAVLIALVAGLCVEVAAQGNPGQNAVCTSASGCSSTIGTSAFIDASVLLQSDICTTIYNILQPATYSTSVIDARGISGTAALTCPANTTPWLKGGGWPGLSRSLRRPGLFSRHSPDARVRGWPTVTFFVKVGTHAADARVFILI
jgi:hypothetical protein